jgi:hypothetical protein
VAGADGGNCSVTPGRPGVTVSLKSVLCGLGPFSVLGFLPSYSIPQSLGPCPSSSLLFHRPELAAMRAPFSPIPCSENLFVPSGVPGA